MTEMSEQMQAISLSTQRLNEISAIFEEIRSKTALIDEIVFQTKILSFNAAVEAERAGEAGRGFSVVAAEVGQLANVSRKSSEDIQELLKQSGATLVAILADFDEKVQRGTTSVGSAQQHFSEIHGRLAAMVQDLDTITQTTQQQDMPCCKFERLWKSSKKPVSRPRK